MVRNKILKLLILTFIFSAFSSVSFAYVADITYQREGDIYIDNPEVNHYFYDELKEEKRIYVIDSRQDFFLSATIFVPEFSNPKGKYSFKVFYIGDEVQEINSVDGQNYEWEEFYDWRIREYYFQGPTLEQDLKAGEYRIEVFSNDNTGKYILKVGRYDSYEPESLANFYWQIPLLKINFFESQLLQFFITPFALLAVALIGAILIVILFIGYLIGLIQSGIKHMQAKTLLLTSGGMDMRDEMIKLLQKPAYNMRVGFITTASKTEEDNSYVKRDIEIMKEIGFNIELFDLDGKKEFEVMSFLSNKDIIYVEGGNAFYLLQSMRRCNFEKIVRKLLKEGIVYVGASAGSVVAGRTIKTANKFGAKGEKNVTGLRNLKGLNLVPFDIFVHYNVEDSEIIIKNIKSRRKREKSLRILTDGQALLVQGKDVYYIGQGEQIII